MGYYKGDPGFLSGLMKVGGAMPGPYGQAARTLGGLMKGKTPVLVTAAAKSAEPTVAHANARVGAIMRHPIHTIMPGGAHTGGTGSMHITGAHVMHTHISRRTGQVVRGRARRMNPYNPHALNRAVRRATRFAHMAKRVLRFVSAKPIKGRAIFRVHRKKKV